MSKNSSGPHDPDHVVVPPKPKGGRLDYTYIIGGILLWGLIGWGLDFLLQTAWIVFAALPVGAACGYYLARHHQSMAAKDDGKTQ